MIASDPEQNREAVPAAALGLSAKTIAVMEMIAQGNSYEQILRARPELTYRDIFGAAREVLTEAARPESSRLEKIRRRHPRAYEKWAPEEESQLEKLILEGHTVAGIAGRLKRQRGAIRIRIMRLGLVEKLSTKEQERLKRILAREQRPRAQELDRAVDNEE